MNPFLFNLEKQLLNDYNQTLLQKELLWFQKSRSIWVQFGDRNTKYFHTTTIIRRRKNRVEALRREDGSWSFDAEEIKQMMKQEPLQAGYVSFLIAWTYV